MSLNDNLPLPQGNVPGPAYKWAVVGMLWFICFFNYADRMAINAVAPVLKQKYNFDDEQMGMVISAFMVVYALSAPFAGQIGDKMSRKFLIIAGLIVWSAVTGATAACRKLWQFVAVRATEGLGETFYFPATMSLISDYHSKRTRSLAMGLHQTSVYAGTIGGTTLAGLLAETYGWESPFVIFGVLGILLGVMLAIFLREPVRNEAERLENPAAATANVTEPAIPFVQFLKEVGRTPSLLLLLMAFCGANAVAMAFMSWLPTHLGARFDMTLAKAAFNATFYLQMGSFLGSILGGLFADRLRLLLPGGRILTQALGACMAIPFIYLSAMSNNVVTTNVFLAILGVAKGLYDANIWASMYDVVHHSRRASMLGLGNMVGWAGAAVVTFGVGLITTRFKLEIGGTLALLGYLYVVVAICLVVAALVFAPRDVKRVNATEIDGEIPV